MAGAEDQPCEVQYRTPITCPGNNARHWLKISKDLHYIQENTNKIYRTAKQCRTRWLCYINPNIKKGHWYVQEDIILLQKYLKLGHRWSLVTKLLTERTENAVKNHWKLLVPKYHGGKCEAAIHCFLPCSIKFKSRYRRWR